MKTILVAPLNWGLGHASRDIPLIAALRAMGHRVVVASEGPALALLRARFAGIEALSLPSYRVRYQAGRSQLLSMLWVALRLPMHNLREHLWLRRVVRSYGIDFVLSDNRYGLWSRRCPCVHITHQLRVLPPPPMGWAGGLVALVLRRWLRRFDWVWVPDTIGPNAWAGQLSAYNGLSNLCYIGLLSRFTLPQPKAVVSAFEMVVVASGPPPHRQLLIDGAAAWARQHGLRCLIVEGNPAAGGCMRSDGEGVTLVGHLSDPKFAVAVRQARYLLFRGGYSSIMDMLALGVSGLLVPTPGQTEQEYLAERLSTMGLFRMAPQHQLAQLHPEQLRVEHRCPLANPALSQAIAAAIG